jgi:hypothetical protein
MPPRFAVVVPVGPEDIDMERARLLLASLARWEPTVGWCVVVEDAPTPRGVSVRDVMPANCRVVTLTNPRRGIGHYWSGAVLTGTLLALAWIQANTDADFVLMIETDALVIGPFADGIRRCFAEHATAGLIGTLGSSSNERFLPDFSKDSQILVAYRLLPVTPTGPDAAAEKPLFVDGVGPFAIADRYLFDTVRLHIAAAVANGYATNAWIQGGAQAAPRTLLDRMATAGYFQYPEVWMHLPILGDQILPMYVRAVGLHQRACTRPHEPFAVQYQGLPYALETLVERGHSLIHSIKNDRRYSERDIREFFLRREGALTH